jgi:hypothetical protein
LKGSPNIKDRTLWRQYDIYDFYETQQLKRLVHGVAGLDHWGFTNGALTKSFSGATRSAATKLCTLTDVRIRYPDSC